MLTIEWPVSDGIDGGALRGSCLARGGSNQRRVWKMTARFHCEGWACWPWKASNGVGGTCWKRPNVEDESMISTTSVDLLPRAGIQRSLWRL